MSVRRLNGASILLVALSLLQGCSPRNPTWASSVNPCCGQDLVLRGIEPPEDRCADIVVDQETARRLMADIGSGAGLTHWHVRFIPGGPACIWREWPGLTDEDFREVRPPEDSVDDGLEPSEGDSSAPSAPREPAREEAD